MFGPLTFGPSSASAQSVEWIRRGSGGAPDLSARYRHAMAYDTARRVTVLFGGGTVAAPGRSGETWE
ncbi:MAG: hypothetical protein H7210_03005, partial [Pyrinomonadaceae bacterium]|nr:hypothetical protein [Phycisphaerales bacterium]